MELIQIIKRNGNLVAFNPEKIYEAIKKAYASVHPIDELADQQIVSITRKVVADVMQLEIRKVPISVIQTFVEQRILDLGLPKVAEAYIEYRIQRDIDRFGYGDEYVVKLHLDKIR